MRAVLGIDAAWTETQPSGIALAIESTDGWQLAAVEPSYQRFRARAENQKAEHRPSGSGPDAPALLGWARALSGRPVDLVAVDMPLAKSPIVGRRASDNSVSQKYGQRWASTHTPIATRPGKISDLLRAGFEDEGYLLRTSAIVSHGLVEVYPHPALIEFANAERRLPYKFGRTRSYWPDETSIGRKIKLWREWERIASLMENEISGVEHALPCHHVETAPRAEWKAYEDMLDAIVCAAVGICVLEGRAVPFGEEDSAIWIPKPGCAKGVPPSRAPVS